MRPPPREEGRIKIVIAICQHPTVKNELAQHYWQLLVAIVILFQFPLRELVFENIECGESQTKVQQNDRNWRLNVFVYWQFDKMFLSCLRRALSQSPRLASMRSAYVMSGRLALHARSISCVTRWNRSPSVTHTPKYEITGTQWQRYLHTPGNCRVSVFFFGWNCFWHLTTGRTDIKKQWQPCWELVPGLEPETTSC